MSYGHSTQFTVKKNGSTEDTITWNQTNNRWEGSSLFLLLTIVSDGKRWQIQEFDGALNGSIVAVGNTFTNGETNNSPADSTYNNGYSVTEVSAGAQGDPHIDPLFGNKYTI